MGGYGQFCPVAKAMELLDERWTMLVVRELLQGSQHFNTLQRGLPHVAGAAVHAAADACPRRGDRTLRGRQPGQLRADPGGQAAPIVEALGQWGTRWMPTSGTRTWTLLMWDVRATSTWTPSHPAGPCCGFASATFPAPPGGRLVITADGVDLCDFDPDHPVTATVESDLRTLVMVWRGDLSWSQALRSGDLELHGPAHVRRAVPHWLRLSSLRPRPQADLAACQAVAK